MIFFPSGIFFASGGQLIQLDRSRSRTCTMDAAPPILCLRRPAYSAGPKLVTDLQHDFFSLRELFCLRRPAYSAGPKQVTDLHHGYGSADPLPPAASLFSWTEARHRPALWIRLRPSSASGGQLVPLDRSSSQTCTIITSRRPPHPVDRVSAYTDQSPDAPCKPPRSIQFPIPACH